MKFILLLVVIAIIVISARTLMAGRGTDTRTAPRIKADETSRTYHTSESPDFDHLPSKVWFESEEAAKIAGFTRWDQMR